MHGITTWYYQGEIPTLNRIVQNTSPLLWQAYNEQTVIGWNQLLRGSMTKSWGEN